MQEKKLHKLGKTDLLSIIYNQQKEINELKKQINDLNEKLEDRTIEIKEAGSIAEASLRLNDIFAKAQAAADQYLASIKKTNEYSQVNNVTTNEEIKESTVEEAILENIDEVNVNIENFEQANIDIDANQLQEEKSNIDSEKVFLDSEKKTFLIPLSPNRMLLVLDNKLQKIEKKKILLALFAILKKFTKKVISILHVLKAYIKVLNLKRKAFNLKIKRLFTKIKNGFLKFLKFIKNKVLKPLFIAYTKFIGLVIKGAKKLTKKSTKIDNKQIEIDLKELKQEINTRQKTKNRLKFAKTLSYSAVVVVSFSIIFATRIFNVIQVSGNSMEPNLFTGDLLVSTKVFGYEKGDMIAFYYNDSILIKRLIATEGDVVYINDEGKVFVNSKEIKEDYITNLAYGNCDITFPFKVPDKEVFVLGDNREFSIDSRNKAIGSISEDKILGKIGMRLNSLAIY